MIFHLYTHAGIPVSALGFIVMVYFILLIAFDEFQSFLSTFLEFFGRGV